MNKKRILSILLVTVMLFSQMAMVSADTAKRGEPCGTDGCNGNLITMQTGSSPKVITNSRVCIHGAPTKTDVEYTWETHFMSICSSCDVGITFSRSNTRWVCNK